jgi:hypothetical protein
MGIRLRRGQRERDAVDADSFPREREAYGRVMGRRGIGGQYDGAVIVAAGMRRRFEPAAVRFRGMVAAWRARRGIAGTCEQTVVQQDGTQPDQNEQDPENHR